MKRETKPMERMSNEPLPLRLAPRCLARTRSGTLCQKPAAKGKKRCRLHGGAEGSGAPCGERNGSYRHGLYTREAIAQRRALRALPQSPALEVRGRRDPLLLPHPEEGRSERGEPRRAARAGQAAGGSAQGRVNNDKSARNGARIDKSVVG